MKKAFERSAVAAFAWLVTCALLLPAGALAQTRPSPSPSPQAKLDAKLTGFPIALGPADSLTITLQVTNKGNAPAAQLEVAVVIYRGVLSRSELAQTYDGHFGRAIASDTIAVDGGLEPGETRSIEVTKPLSELDAFRDSTTDRAHPVRIMVQAGDVSSPPIDTHMIFFSQPPEKPLGIGLVIPLHSPSIYTDANRPNVVTSDSLEQSLTGGRLDNILKALEQQPDVPVTLAPSGLLLSMLQDMSDGYLKATKHGVITIGPEDHRALAAAKALTSIRALVARPNTRLIATSYSPTSLPALNRYSLDDLALTQLTEGRDILKSEPVGLLRAQPLPGWLLPSNGDLDDATLTALRRTDLNDLLLSAGSVRDQSGNFTRGLPVKIQAGAGSVTAGLEGAETVALVTDPGLYVQLQKEHELGVIEARQRFAAETATIQLETPGLVRAVVALAPLDWQVQPGNVDGVLATLAQASWLHAATPDQIVDQLKPPAGQGVRLSTTDSVLQAAQGLPSESYFRDLEEGQKFVKQYAELAPPPAQLGALNRRLLIAESSDWWVSKASLARGVAFARSIPTTVTSQIKMIRAPAPQTITLTSKTGIIPLALGSALKYPVDVVVRLESDKLRFPDGNRVEVPKLRPPNQTIRVRAITQASGTFPLKVQVLTPGGQLVSDSQLTIRSTAYNIVALSITGGAAVFLIGWWAIGAFRKRFASDGD